MERRQNAAKGNGFMPDWTSAAGFDAGTESARLPLLEVMKTFNQIGYGGAGFPEDAEVVEVRVADRDEVRAGQVLVVVRA